MRLGVNVPLRLGVGRATSSARVSGIVVGTGGGLGGLRALRGTVTHWASVLATWTVRPRVLCTALELMPLLSLSLLALVTLATVSL